MDPSAGSLGDSKEERGLSACCLFCSCGGGEEIRMIGMLMLAGFAS